MLGLWKLRGGVSSSHWRATGFREDFIKEVSFKGQAGKHKEGRIGTCQVHLVLKDRRRKYVWFVEECR